MRAKLRSDTEEPTSVLSRTERDAPKLTMPNSDKADPIRLKDLKDNDDPR
jgi:hypothetical protein